MNISAASAILMGVVIIVSRAPLIVFPSATRDTYLKMPATNNRARVMGLFVLVAGVLIILAHHGGQGPASFFMRGLGWVMAAAALLFMLVLASVWRLVTESVLKAMDSLMLRGLGVLSIIIGGLFIWLGWKML